METCIILPVQIKSGIDTDSISNRAVRADAKSAPRVFDCDWECEWRDSGTSRLAFSFFPEIGKYLEAEWLILNKTTTYLVTGHGPWKLL